MKKSVINKRVKRNKEIGTKENRIIRKNSTNYQLNFQNRRLRSQTRRSVGRQKKKGYTYPV